MPGEGILHLLTPAPVLVEVCGAGADPEHGVCVGDAVLPVAGHRHVRRVGAVGLPRQRILLHNLPPQGEQTNAFSFILSFWEPVKK